MSSLQMWCFAGSASSRNFALDKIWVKFLAHFFQWYMMCETSHKSASDEGTTCTQAALLGQVQKEAALLQTSAKSILADMAENEV